MAYILKNPLSACIKKFETIVIFFYAFFMFILHGQPSSHSSPLQNILSHINYVFFHTLWFYCLYSTSSVVFCFCHTAATVDLGIEEELTLPPTDGADTLFGDAIKVILFLSKSSSFAAVVFEEVLKPSSKSPSSTFSRVFNLKKLKERGKQIGLNLFSSENY